MSKRIDLTGQRFGRLVVLGFSHKGKHRSYYWRCQCDCGKIKTVMQGSLRMGRTKSCGCYRIDQIHLKHRINIPIGTRFGRLVVLSIAKSRDNKAYWKCRCDCGIIKEIESHRLRKGDTKSCGCYRREQMWLPKGEAAFNRLYQRYQYIAEKKGYTFCLSRIEFKTITTQNCHYCGIVPKTSVSHNYIRCNGDYIYNGIDRVDNNKGYVEKNVVACCSMCNQMKKAYSQEEFLEQVKKIYEHSVKRK